MSLLVYIITYSVLGITAIQEVQTIDLALRGLKLFFFSGGTIFSFFQQYWGYELWALSPE